MSAPGQSQSESSAVRVDRRGDRGESAERLRVLIVGEGVEADTLEASLREAAMEVERSRPASAAERAAAFRPNVVLVDALLPRPAPADVIARVRAVSASICALWTHDANAELIVLAHATHADSALVWPVTADAVRRLASIPLIPKIAARHNPTELPAFVVGDGGPMREVWRLVALAARSDSSVVVNGETGVGKEVVARTLHLLSPRRAGPFIAINCAAIPETLLETELFGHERGAFTGAQAQRKGRFELADQGTLFLDEIGDLALSLQVKLLRVLQERVFERLGGTQSIRVNVRVVAATHQNLKEAVQRGRFRADLFYRLSVLSIHIPPLRERKGDILQLWEHLIAEGCKHENRLSLETSAAARRLLLRHDWPGNIRELHNAAQHALMVTTGDRILPADLPEYLSQRQASPPGSFNAVGLTLAELERNAILETCNAVGSVAAAAEMLGISPRKIHYRLKEYREEGLLPTSAPSPAGPDDSNILDDQRRKRVRILLADDDDDLRWAMVEALKIEGYDVIAVPNGRALLEHLGASLLLEEREGPPDLIISDVRMPGLTGMQILESVRKRGWSTPVVLMSAFADDDVHRRAKALGAAAFLDKPVDLKQLRDVVDAAIHPAPRSAP